MVFFPGAGPAANRCKSCPNLISMTDETAFSRRFNAELLSWSARWVVDSLRMDGLTIGCYRDRSRFQAVPSLFEERRPCVRLRCDGVCFDQKCAGKPDVLTEILVSAETGKEDSWTDDGSS